MSAGALPGGEGKGSGEESAGPRACAAGWAMIRGLDFFLVAVINQCRTLIQGMPPI